MIIQCIFIFIIRIPLYLPENDTQMVMVFNNVDSGNFSVSVDLYKDDETKEPKEQLKNYPKSIHKLNDSYYTVSPSSSLISYPKLISKGSYYIVPSTFNPVIASISVDIFTNKKIESTLLKEAEEIIDSDLLRLDERILYRQSYLYFSNNKIEKVPLTTTTYSQEELDEIELLKKQLYCSLGENISLNKEISIYTQDKSIFNRKITETDQSVKKLQAELINAKSRIKYLEEINKYEEKDIRRSEMKNSLEIIKEDVNIENENELNKLRDELKEKDAIILSLKIEKERMEEKIREINENIDTKSDYVNLLDKIEILNNELEKKKNEYSNELNILQKIINEKDELLLSIKSENERMEKEIKEIKESIIKPEIINTNLQDKKKDVIIYPDNVSPSISLIVYVYINIRK